MRRLEIFPAEGRDKTADPSMAPQRRRTSDQVF
jgi:hypothetical protein